jgi:cytochrome b
MSNSPRTPARLVWDLPLRVFHWLLALAVLGCWITSRLGVRAFVWHRWLGYVTLVLIFFRIAWGFFGPRHARFSSFIRGPATVWRYGVLLLRGGRGAAPEDEHRYPGHNPVGALMVVLMLTLVLGVAVTGLFANDELFNTGPLYGYLSDEASDRATTWHSRLMDGLWVLMALHVIAVLAWLIVGKSNLIGPMMTGRKREPWLRSEDEISSSRVVLAILISAVGAIVLYALIATAPEPSSMLF